MVNAASSPPTRHYAVDKADVMVIVDTPFDCRTGYGALTARRGGPPHLRQ